MSDLQCPATVVFVPDAARADSLPTARFRVARVLSPNVRAATELVAAVEGTADEYRGECVAVVAPSALVAEALTAASVLPPRCPEPGAGWIAVEVDADGWRVVPPAS